MSRLIVLLLSLCVTVLAMEDPPVPKAEPEPSPEPSPATTNSSTSVVSPTIVDHYDRFSLEEDMAKEKEGMEHKDTLMHDLLSEDPHLHHVPLTPGELLPSYDVSKDNATKDNNDSMETTTKKTFIMKIPVTVTKSPMMDAMMNNTKDHDESMMKDDPSIHSGVVHTDNKDTKKTTMMPGHSSSSSSQLVGNNATKVSDKSSGNIISPTFIVAILAVLGSKLC